MEKSKKVKQVKQAKKEVEVKYQEYIISEEWKAKSKKWIMESNGCERCGSFTYLTCHHKHYRTLGFERRFDVKILCWNCHKKHHQLKGERVYTKPFEERLYNIRQNIKRPKTIRRWKNQVEKEMGWELTR